MAPQTLDLTEAYIHDDVFSNKGRRRARFSAPEGLDKLSSWEELQERPPLDGADSLRTSPKVSDAPSEATLASSGEGTVENAALSSRSSRSGTLGSILDPGRCITIATTAALPWLTGTSINPLLRAAFLSKDGSRRVLLLVPWLARSDQERLYPKGLCFSDPASHEAYIRDWVDQRVGFPTTFEIRFYAAWYSPSKCSILPVGDITRYVTQEEADIAVLEEPEHLNWFHSGTPWRNKFRHVVGVAHTNYLDYWRREANGAAKVLLFGALNAWVCRAHCHKVIKLSGAVQRMPRELIEFVHGVSPAFLDVGDRKRAAIERGEGADAFPKGAYFIGKALWGKGYAELLDLLAQHKNRTGAAIPMALFGSGEDMGAIERRACELGLGLAFKGFRDHIDEELHDYRVMVNPSASDVVATSVAEALAMGKTVVLPDLPCNAFFKQFRNCLIYRSPDEFSDVLQTALTRVPEPQSAEERRILTWEDASMRFLTAAEIDGAGRAGWIGRAVDWVLSRAHRYLMSSEAVRVALGAGVGTAEDPEDLEHYEPPIDYGGLLDSRQRAVEFYARGGEAAKAG